VLEGSVRKAGQRLRVTGQLIDAETGAHIWADRFDGALEDVFDLQDRITAAVVGAIAPEIRSAEIERATRKRPENLDAYDHFLRAQAAINQFRLREADTRLSAALDLAPDYTDAMALRAWIRTILWHADTVVNDENCAFAVRTANFVLAAPDADIEAQAYAGYVIAFFTEDFERGLSHVTQAIETCPSCNSAWGSSCLLNGMHARTETALTHGETALKLNPRDPMAYRVHMGMAFADIANRDFESLLARLDRIRAFVNSVLVFQFYEIAANANLGRLDRARTLAEKLLAVHPEFTISELRTARVRVFAHTPRLYDPIYEGLAAAGIPE
jgi:adenylate cyclase